jgi:hypothetical protein
MIKTNKRNANHSSDDLYDVSKYTDNELYDVLDLTDPSDRVLEAKLLIQIDKYKNTPGQEGQKLTQFFIDIYNHFFGSSDDDLSDSEFSEPINRGYKMEGFETIQSTKSGQSEQSNKMNETNNNNGPKESKEPNVMDKTVSLTKPLDYSKDKLNPLLKQTLKRIISIDSQFRDISVYPSTTDFTFTLSDPLKDVLSLKLYSVQIPYTWYTINNNFGSNLFYLKGITAGNDDGNYDFKIEIPTGNYTALTLIDAVNKSISDLKTNTNYSDVNFGTTQISYDLNNSKATLTIDLTKIYNETNYYLEFPNWSSPNVDQATRLQTLPGFLGYNSTTYTPYSIYSARTLPKISDTVDSDNTHSIYLLDTSNNFFTINQYTGPQIFVDASTNPIIQSITIQLSTLTTGKKYTRNAIVNAINTSLTTNPYLLSTESSLTRIDISDNLQINNGSSYFDLSVKLNRKTTSNLYNLKTNIVFPVEQSTSSFRYNIWTGTNSCLQFTDISETTYDSTNELNNIISETETLHSSYNIVSNPYFVLRCTKPKYINYYVGGDNDGKPYNYNPYPVTGITAPLFVPSLDASMVYMNDYAIILANSITAPYTTDEYVNAINSAIVLTNGKTVDPVNLPNGDFDIPKNDVTRILESNMNFQASDTYQNKANLKIDLNKTFNQNYYFMDITESYLYSGLDLSYNGLTLNIDLSGTDVNPKNIFQSTINVSPTTYKITGQYLIKIYPNIFAARGNQNDDPYIVPIPDTQPVEGYSTWQLLRDAINNQFKIYQSNDGQFPLQGTNLAIFANNDNTKIECLLTVNVVNTLTQTDYELQFYDPSSNQTWSTTDTTNSWASNLFFDQQIYNLKTNLVQNESYSQITGTTPMGQTTITLYDGSNNYFYIKVLQNTAGLSTSSSANDIKITIDASAVNIEGTGGTVYTQEKLFTAINTQFQKYSDTSGSTISMTAINKALYTNIRLNINKAYTSNDYSLVFYDTTSNFVKCISGSNSARNVAWDTSLGWILGFRESTVYDIIDMTGSDITNPNIKSITGDTCVSVNLFNYFLIVLNDYNQNHLNDGLVTITSKNAGLPLPSYASRASYICDPITGQLVASSGQTPITQNQLYSLNQILDSKKAKPNFYSPGPFVKDVFGLIPIKTAGMTNGQIYVEFGGSLQNQDRTFFGPVNIKRMSVQLVSDRGDIIDLNGANWGFSLICEQLYEQTAL